GPITPRPTANAKPKVFAESKSIYYFYFNNSLMRPFYSAMRLFPVRLHNSELDEHQGKERKYGRLQETHKGLEQHQRHRQQVRQKGRDNGDEHFAGKNISEKPE